MKKWLLSTHDLNHAEWLAQARKRRYPAVYIRDAFNELFSFAVPKDVLLEIIADRSPNGVIEIGAGRGYWAKLLRERGVDVLAYDMRPGCVGEYRVNNGLEAQHATWTSVLEGNEQMAAAHPERTLLLIWPEHGEMAARTLTHYRGNTLIYIGEHPNHAPPDDDIFEPCTADDELFDMLAEQWELVVDLEIERLHNSYDRFFIYTRKA